MRTIVFPRTLREKIGEDGSGSYPHIRFQVADEAINEIKSIHLYAPQGIQVGDGANYAGVELGTIRGIQNIAAEGLGGKVDLGKDEGVVMGIKLADKFLGVPEEIAAGIAQQRGIAFNQQTALTFEGMNLRTFTFSFVLVPESADESKDIRLIENFFRKYMYSEVDGFVAKFPEKFRIQFYDGAKENPFMPFIHDCFLSGMETTYNPESNMYYSTDKDDEKASKAPASIGLSLTFSEARVLSRQDIYGAVIDEKTKQVVGTEPGFDYNYDGGDRSSVQIGGSREIDDLGGVFGVKGAPKEATGVATGFPGPDFVVTKETKIGKGDL